MMKGEFRRGSQMPQTFNYIDFSEKLTATLDKSASLSKDRYISEDFMRSEWNGIWTKAWLFAGLESDLSETGDFFVYDIGRESIVITRNDENEISAFYNVCQHRGNKIVTLESGSFNKVSCPYHGWTYGLDGTLSMYQIGSCLRREFRVKRNLLSQLRSQFGLV